MADGPRPVRPTKAPQRTCVGCREAAAKHELLRVVAVAGILVPDPTGRAVGRGAHLHPTLGCLELALRRRAFGRALRRTETLDPSQLEEFVRHRQDRPIV